METNERVNLCSNTLYLELLTDSFSICIEFIILRGFASTFKVFWPIWIQFLFLLGFPSIFSDFWADFSVSRRSGLVLLFPTLCRIWGSDGVVSSLNRVSGYGQLDDPAWVEPQRPPHSTHLSSPGKDPVELPTMRTKHIRTWSGGLVEQCWAGWVRIRVERWRLSEHCMPRPRTHCGLPRRSLLPIIGTLDGRKCCHTQPSKMDAPYSQKREEKLFTMNY